MDADQLKKIIEEATKPPPEGWAHSTGESPLKKQLQNTVELLGDAKLEMEKELAHKLKTLKTLTEQRVVSNPRYRVKKNPKPASRP